MATPVSRQPLVKHCDGCVYKPGNVWPTTTVVCLFCIRRHKAALVKEQGTLDTRKYSFSQKVINEWNKLSNDCVNVV